MKKGKDEEKMLTEAHTRMCRIVRAMDKRVILFEFVGNYLLASGEVPLLMGIDPEQWKRMKEDKQAFIDFFLEQATEVSQPEKENVRHFVRMMDRNEKYIISHVFWEDEDVYGFLVDKSGEIYGKFHMQERYDKIRQESETDKLTGLFNRNGFEKAVRKAFSERPGQGMLLIMDMDNFKKVNDMLGHPVGDKVLKQYAELLRSHFADRDRVTGRLGGDEFVVFLHKTPSKQELQNVLSGFLKLVKETFAAEYPEQKLSASIGAAYAEAADDYDGLYKKADAALYNVKENGKGNFKCYSSEDSTIF